MRILYESDLAGSSQHGMAYRIFQFSKKFQEKGHEVLIVAASFSHVRYTNPVVKKSITDEKIDGIKYKWIKTPRYSGNGLGRVVHMLVYNFKLWYYSKKIIKDFIPDVVIASGVTPLDFIGCNKIAKLSKAKIILEVGDLWPLSPIELGGYSKLHPFIKIMQWAENYSYKNTNKVVSLLPCAKEYMEMHGLKGEKFNYIPNGILVEDWKEKKELPEPHKSVIENLLSKNYFIIGYAGAHGLANSLDSLIESFNLLRNENIALLLVGDGSEKENLIGLSDRLGLENVKFLPPLLKKEIPSFLSIIDVLFIGLQKQPLFRFGISPNKLFDYMMASKPIIQSIEAGNDIVKEANCGVSIEPENPDEIAKAIKYLRSLPLNEREKLGKNGFEYVKEKHTYSVLTDMFLNVIES